MTPLTRVPRAVSAARSREAILDAALELFSEQGYDETPTEQVAERAGVSPRTFFRYFPTKESVVFSRRLRARCAGSRPSCRRSPRPRSDFDAICATFVSLSAGFEELRERVQRYRRVVDSSSVLLGREHLHSQEHAQTIARALAHRNGRG